MALTTNPLFFQENLETAIDHLDETIDVLSYDTNTRIQQFAGEELRSAKWVLTTIYDLIFDYGSAEDFLQYNEPTRYLLFKRYFLSHISQAIKKALGYVENNFAVYETVHSIGKYCPHSVPPRDLEKEANVIAIFKTLITSSDEVFVFLNSPKMFSDPHMPSAEMIKDLVKKISDIQKGYDHLLENVNPLAFGKLMAFVNRYEVYKHPLRQAWEVYHYGSHSDFWKEGDSMIEYLMYESRATEILNKLIMELSQDSMFDSFPGGKKITRDLLNVYRHLLTQNLKH